MQLTRFLRQPPRFSAFRAARPSVASLSRRTTWSAVEVAQIATKFNWPAASSLVDNDEVKTWATQKGLAKVDEFLDYLEEKPEDAIRKAARAARLARDNRYAELIPTRYKERDAVLDSIVETSWFEDNFVLVSGPKAIGKSTLLHAVACELNTRDGYECVWVRCHENEDGFLKEWLMAMGIPIQELSEVPSFEQVAEVLIEGRGELQFKYTAGEDSGPEGSTALEVDVNVKTIVFVDGLRERHSYIYRLQDIARQQSEHAHAMYVLVASDSADAFRSVRKFETRLNHIICHPFDRDTMKEYIQYTLRRTSGLKFGDLDRVTIDDEVQDDDEQTALDRLVDLVKKYTWQATNGAKFAVAGVNPDGSFSEEKVAAAAQAFVEKYSAHVSARLFREAGWNMDNVRKFIEEFGENNVMDVYKYRQVLGDPAELSDRNFAYHDELNVYMMPEVFQAMKYMIKRDAMVGK